MIHCDLKPLNVMVGTFGEVLVMDWGVARLVTPTGPVQLIEAPVTTTSDAQTSADVAGTPAYMPPEQALGDATQIGPPSDVYALGVMLFELLAGERPYQGGVPTIVFQAAQGVVPPLPRRPETIVDDSLYEIIVKAMRPSPADRYPDASALGEHVARWRDGAIRREKAIAVVRDAAARLEVLAPRRARAAALRARSAEVLAQLASDAGVEAKRDAWAEEDEARALEREVALAGAEVRQLLEAALVHAPELAEPKALLADLAFAEHRDAERRRAWDAAAQHEVRLRAYDLGAYADYLEGRARLVVWTAEPCEARVARYERRDRTLVAVPTGQVMPTPLDVDLPAGSYRVELVAAGRAPVIYPVRLRRRGDWKGERPGAPGPTPVELPRSLDAETEVFVPAGPFELGDDTSATEEPWVEAFVMQRSPVTFRELARFLADRAGARFRRDVLRDGLGLFRADWPAVGLSWEGARAYGEWLSERTGHAWRLPYEIEWEKAARGVDGRSYPWGDEADAAFAHVRTADRASDAPVSVSAFPVDCSPYGARGMAGNVRDWCLDGLVVASSGTEGRTPSGLSSRRVVRGGSYRLAIEAARCTTRSGLPGAQGYRDVGFRLVRKP